MGLTRVTKKGWLHTKTFLMYQKTYGTIQTQSAGQPFRNLHSFS